jgi:hypothetical protein
MKTPEQIRAEFEPCQGQRQAAFSEAFHAEMCSGGSSSGNYVDDAKEWFDNGWQACAATYETALAEKDAEIARLRQKLQYITDITATRPPEDAAIPLGEWYYNQLMHAQYQAKQALTTITANA